MYMAMWEPRVGESFLALHESNNEHDGHEMAVCDEDPGVIMGHFTTRDIETSVDCLQCEGD